MFVFFFCVIRTALLYTVYKCIPGILIFMLVFPLLFTNFFREQDSNKLRQVLDEKEGLLADAVSIFRESETAMAAKQEAFASEKADVEGELEVQALQ